MLSANSSRAFVSHTSFSATSCNPKNTRRTIIIQDCVLILPQKGAGDTAHDEHTAAGAEGEGAVAEGGVAEGDAG